MDISTILGVICGILFGFMLILYGFMLIWSELQDALHGFMVDELHGFMVDELHGFMVDELHGFRHSASSAGDGWTSWIHGWWG